MRDATEVRRGREPEDWVFLMRVGGFLCLGGGLTGWLAGVWVNAAVGGLHTHTCSAIAVTVSLLLIAGVLLLIAAGIYSDEIKKGNVRRRTYSSE